MKTRRYWLRGLFVGLVAGLGFLVVPVVSGLACMGFNNGVDKETFSAVLCPVVESTYPAIGHPIFLPLWIILGVLAGWFYGKIKNRNIAS
jgi:hypothetical protein